MIPSTMRCVRLTFLSPPVGDRQAQKVKSDQKSGQLDCSQVCTDNQVVARVPGRTERIVIRILTPFQRYVFSTNLFARV
jgi:hypothetical protein